MCLQCPVAFCSFPVCPTSATSLLNKPEAFLAAHAQSGWSGTVAHTQAMPLLDRFLSEVNNESKLLFFL